MQAPVSSYVARDIPALLWACGFVVYGDYSNTGRHLTGVVVFASYATRHMTGY